MINPHRNIINNNFKCTMISWIWKMYFIIMIIISDNIMEIIKDIKYNDNNLIILFFLICLILKANFLSIKLFFLMSNKILFITINTIIKNKKIIIIKKGRKPTRFLPNPAITEKEQRRSTGPRCPAAARRRPTQR